jgi:hypothetical protein
MKNKNMDKKIVYYVIAGAVLILIIGIIIAVNPGSEKTVTVEEEPPAEQAVKTETEVNRDIAEKLNLAEGQLPLRVTIEDNGQSASLTPGKNITLMLGENYDWTITSSNDMVLAKRSLSVDDSRVQGVYQVVGEGNAILSAEGKCKSGAVCEKPVQTFTFDVDGVISENFSPEDLTK